MKRFAALLCVLLLLACSLPAYAAEGNLTYSGDAGRCIFAPGSEYSPTDLFPDFKDVMPGDTLTQVITVRNDASDKVKVKFYLRALGAHEESEEFLSQLRLTVARGGELSYLFDAPADETAQLSDWVYLGTLYSGGEAELTVTLHVPVVLDNQFRQYVGYLDCEVAIEEPPVEPTDPQPPEAGDGSRLILWLLPAAVSLAAVAYLLRRRLRRA